MKRYQAILIVSSIVGALCTIGHLNAQSQDADDQRYCEMVKIYKQTNGENGWPDFRETYKHQCAGNKQ